jgi:HK97 gp10 family phage protein
MEISYQIKGGKELADLLTKLHIEVETKLVRGGLKAGANIIRDEAKRLAPRKSGAMANAIKSSSSAPNASGQIVARVRLSGKHAFLGRFMEYGVLPHLIFVKGKGSLVIDGVPIGKQVLHPGFAARPFMRPALDSKAQEAVQAFGDYLTRNIKWGTITAPTVQVDMEDAA